MILQPCNFQNYASHRGRGAHFQKIMKVLEKDSLYSHQSREKKHKPSKIHKIASVAHAVVFADRALEAKIAQVMGENQNFDGRLKRKKGEPNGQRSDKCQKDGPMSPYLRHSGLQKVDF